MEQIGLTSDNYTSSLTKEQKKNILLDYLKEQNTFIPTIIITKDIGEQHDIRPIEIPDLLEEMEQEGLVNINLGLHGFNKKWAYRPKKQGNLSPVFSQWPSN